MAKITTYEGVHWFYIGDFKNKEEARQYAIKYTRDFLLGTASNVKEVTTKIEWVRHDRRIKNLLGSTRQN